MSELSKFWEDFSGQTGADAARKSAKQQIQAVMQAMEEMRSAFGSGIGKVEEMYGEGMGRFAGLDEMLGENFKAGEGYGFRRDQGEQSIMRSAGRSRSPYGSAATKSLMNFNQDLASEEYGNWYGRKAGLAGGMAGLGSDMANSIAQLFGAQGRGMSELWTQFGNARSAGTAGAASAESSGANNVAQAIMSIWGGGSD